MREQYEEFYNRYIRICQKKRGLPPTDELRNALQMAMHYGQKLLGMLDLMEACGVISSAEKTAETRKVTHEFSGKTLYNAYLSGGEIYSFREDFHG